MELLLSVRLKILSLLRVESTTNSNGFQSKDGTAVRIPDADLSITPWSITKYSTSCFTHIRTATICVNNQGLIGNIIFDLKSQLSQ
ncbi:hypothetical protein TNCV_702101 [Trichonephila clavipes]|nr:hypothetical protein TNCV_702101 [Trichonephila clavipes]